MRFESRGAFRLAGARRRCRLAGCATARTTCPLGTELARRIIRAAARPSIAAAPTASGKGAETRYYESGAEHVAGEYVDGTQSGVWRYRFNNGRNWRAERWDDGALVSKTVDPAVARHVARRSWRRWGRRHRGIIKLASHDPRLAARRASRAAAASSSATPTGGRASPATTTPTACASGSGASGTRTATWRARSNTWRACASARRANGTRTARPRPRASTSRANAKGGGAGGTRAGGSRASRRTRAARA